MNLLFSDYDGTLKPFNNNPNILEKITFKKNINSINKLTKNNNKFIITTGRTTESLLNEINKYKINYDYITTYDGRVSFDNKNKLIYSLTIEKYILKEIKNILNNKPYYKKITLYNSNGLTTNYEDIIIIIIKLDNKELYKYIMDLLKDYKQINMKYSLFTNNLIISINSNKSLGIKKLLDSENIEVTNENIITVGDGLNDLEMLKDYNGYKMLISHPQLYYNIDKTTTSVNKLIKKLINI